MKLYKTIYIVANSNIEQVVWGGSLTEASKARAQLKRDGHEVIGTQTKEVPTAKGPLLEWLNENAKT